MLYKRNGFAGVYVHFPYCIHKCSYCDFYSVGIGKTIPEQNLLFESYKKETLHRLRENPEFKNYTIDSIFFGGGTPSLADLGELNSFLNFLRDNFKVLPSAEVSIEMNPEDIELERINSYHSIGINRVNVGVQTFNLQFLKTIDRYHDIEKYSSILGILEKSNIPRYGIDLIYGIPQQTAEDFYKDLETAISSPKIKHLSLYSLTVEEGTPYFRALKETKASPPEEELQTKILLELPKILSLKNFRQYEVSNYSIPGMECLHNLKYWSMEYYLGIGPGAHGYTPKGRYSNPKNTNLYLKQNWKGEYIESNYFEELCLSLFRVFLPIDLDSFLEGKTLNKNSIHSLLYQWKEKGICNWNGSIFQWKPESVLYLDNYILQLAGA